MRGILINEQTIAIQMEDEQKNVVMVYDMESKNVETEMNYGCEVVEIIEESEQDKLIVILTDYISLIHL